MNVNYNHMQNVLRHFTQENRTFKVYVAKSWTERFNTNSIPVSIIS